MRRLPHVSLILGMAVFMAADEVKKPENSPRRTESTVGSVLGAAQWVTVSNGFVLRVYSNQDLTEITERRAAYEKRRQEFLAKRKPLDERRAAIRPLVSGVERYRRYAKHLLELYDTNKDGALDGEEQKKMRQDPSAFDANMDNKISIGELVVYLLSSTSQETAKDVPENPDGLIRELDALDSKTDRLTKQYKDVLTPQTTITYYKIIEVAKDFLRVRYKNEERIIPFASIREIRRTLKD